MRVPPGGRVLVTGATGFIGRPLIERLSAAGYLVTAMGRRARPSGISQTIEYIEADLSTPGSLSMLLPFRWDAIVNVAGSAPKTELSWDDGVDLIATHVRIAAQLFGALPHGW